MQANLANKSQESFDRKRFETMQFAKLFTFIVVGLTSLTCLADGTPIERIANPVRWVAERERQTWAIPVHNSEFAAVPGAAVRSDCADFRAPEPMATPDPFLDEMDTSSVLSVSFIIGTDGRVSSALMLDSGGPNQDRSALATVQSWRYRPALCDGTPTNVEARVRFYRH